jgi:hypothetical protein
MRFEVNAREGVALISIEKVHATLRRTGNRESLFSAATAVPSWNPASVGGVCEHDLLWNKLLRGVYEYLALPNALPHRARASDVRGIYFQE